MYKTKINTRKTQEVERIAGLLRSAKHYVLTNYSGLSVESITELRRKLSDSGTRFHVVKNSYAKIAFQQEKLDGLDFLLTGPTALSLTEEDVASALKDIFDFSENTTLEIKGGLVDGTICGTEALKKISKLPTRNVLFAQLMGTCMAPVQNCAGVLSGVIQKLMRTLTAVANAK